MSYKFDTSIKIDESILDPYTSTTILKKYKHEDLLNLFLVQTIIKGKSPIISYSCHGEFTNEFDCSECGDLLNHNSILIIYANISWEKSEKKKPIKALPVEHTKSSTEPPKPMPTFWPLPNNNCHFVCDGHKGTIKCALCKDFIWEKTILFPFALKSELTYRYYCEFHIVEVLRKNILSIIPISTTSF